VTDILNFNPGLVPNGPDGKSCFLSCSQMLFRTLPGIRVPSFAELDELLHRKEGEFSWEYPLLNYFAGVGFEVRYFSTFNLHRFVEEGNPYMYEYFGPEAAENQIKNSDIDQARADTKAFLSDLHVEIIPAVPQLADIRSLLQGGFYLIPYVNQKILQADEGYVAHTVFIYGFSPRGVRIHNPGPPATEASEIAWPLFEKAWSSPTAGARILFAARPRQQP
jgi:hypothetical protein